MGQTLAWYADHPEAFAALEDEWMEAQFREYEEWQDQLFEEAMEAQFRISTFHYMPGHEDFHLSENYRWENFSVPLGWGTL